MATPTLASLPADIIRIVVRMEENAMDEMRFISPSWNTLVLEHLSNPRYRRPLEKLTLTCGVTETTEHSEYSAQDDEMRKRHGENVQQMHFVALVPDGVECRIGLSKWLTVSQRLPGKIEVKCAPQKIRPNYDYTTIICYYAYNILLAFTAAWLGGTIVLYGLGVESIITTVPFVIVFIFRWIFLNYYVCNSEECKLEKAQIARLSRLFSSFSHVTLLHMNSVAKDRNALSYASRSLKGVHVERLRVWEHICDKEKQERIVQLTREHGIKHIIVAVFKCEKNNLCKFFLEIAKLGATVTIYEAAAKDKYYKEVREYFHRPASFWDKMATDLKKEGVCLAMETIHDNGFSTVQTGTSVRATITCSPI